MEDYSAKDMQYLVAIKDIKSWIETSHGNVVMGKICKTHGVDGMISAVMVKGGLLSKKGAGRGLTWKWESSVEPNIHMAQRVIDDINAYHRQRQMKYHADLQAQKIDDKEPQQQEPQQQEPQKREVKVKLRYIYIFGIRVAKIVKIDG